MRDFSIAINNNDFLKKLMEVWKNYMFKYKNSCILYKMDMFPVDNNSHFQYITLYCGTKIDSKQNLFLMQLSF